MQRRKKKRRRKEERKEEEERWFSRRLGFMGDETEGRTAGGNWTEKGNKNDSSRNR